MSLLESIHDRHVADRRVRVLCSHLANMVPENASVLDVGCGDGKIAWLLSQQRPDLSLTGVEVLVRDNTPIPIQPFNGQELPFNNHSFDVVSFVDVLHHCDRPIDLLREAHRVARRRLSNAPFDGLGGKPPLWSCLALQLLATRTVAACV
jgi:ubiquinone/menaquinone biosynthesis C-methylase UbiE